MSTHGKIFGGLAGGILAVALAAAAPPARADAANQASELTFSQPVALPGHTVLPAGTYWFMQPEPFVAPNVIQVRDANRVHVVATFMAVPTERMFPTDNTQLKFAEQSNDGTVALRDWYYPSTLTGHQFLFSSRHEAQLNEDPQITVQATSPNRG